MTVTTVLLISILLLVTYYGGVILARLPKPKRHDDFGLRSQFTFEDCNYWLAFRVETIIEDEFRVAYADDWEIGRSFSIFGPVFPLERDHGPRPPKVGGRSGVKIGLGGSWFESSRLGSMRFFENGGSEGFVHLPFQIARQVLDEVRRDPDQLVVLGFNESAADVKPKFPVYSFELMKTFD
jgi:hypothetical protein